jgi:Flp pilus assembly protein TadB
MVFINMPNPAKRSISRGLLIAVAGAAIAIVILVVGEIIHAGALAIAIVAGLAFLGFTLVGSFRARAQLKRELDADQGFTDRK